MNAYEYLHALQQKNPKVLMTRAAKITITVSSFEELIVHAFNRGVAEGKENAAKEKSLFEQLFGKIETSTER